MEKSTAVRFLKTRRGRLRLRQSLFWPLRSDTVGRPSALQTAHSRWRTGNFLASVNHVGRSSMEIGIKVVAEDIRDKLIRHTNSCYLTMVAVDAEGNPASVPPLSLATPLQQLRFEKAALRKNA